jgi:Mycotoxin biosynthesis protein UstYa
MDVIRQRLMCTADTELHPYIWAGDPPHVTPDFNRMYKCRNYNDIQEYANQKQAQWGPNGPDVAPEEGALILDAIP